MATLDEQWARIEERREKLKARMDARKAREREQEDKWRTQALIVLGGLVLKRAKKDWKNVDAHDVDEILESVENALQSMSEGVEHDAREAHAHFNDFKAEQREEMKARRAAKRAAIAEQKAQPEPEPQPKEQPAKKPKRAKKPDPVYVWASDVPDGHAPFISVCPECGTPAWEQSSEGDFVCQTCKKKGALVAAPEDLEMRAYSEDLKQAYGKAKKA